MQELLLINGERVAAVGGATFERRDPFTGGVASVSAAATAEDAVAAADNAAGAFRAWSGSAHRERRRLLMAASAVMEAHADLFTGLMTAEIGATAAWSRTQIGPLADPAAPARVRALVEDARSGGASVAVGGTSAEAVFEPTVLTGVSADMKVYHEEIFGPVAPVTFVDSVDEAVTMANDTAFGLSAGVLTGDYDKGLAIAASLRTGMAHVNDQPVNDEPHAPFGGVGDSGYGRFGAAASIEFTELRWTTVQRQPREFHL